LRLRDASGLAQEQHRAEVRADAVEDFRNHIITTLVDDPTKRVHVFKCATPDDSNNLKFYVSVLPSAILVHGDIGELLIDHPSGGLTWLCGSVESMDYFLGKAYKLEETQFCEGDALALLDDEEWRDKETRDAIREGWHYASDDSEPARTWAEAVYEVTGDSEFPRCVDYDRESLWCYEALRWFVAKLNTTKASA
jgi:hypothetical protein